MQNIKCPEDFKGIYMFMFEVSGTTVLILN